jgi:hypothetical protein
MRVLLLAGEQSSRSAVAALGRPFASSGMAAPVHWMAPGIGDDGGKIRLKTPRRKAR